jgi:hypothetical protein
MDAAADQPPGIGRTGMTSHGLAGEDREMRVLLEQLGGRLSDRRYRRMID